MNRPRPRPHRGIATPRSCRPTLCPRPRHQPALYVSVGHIFAFDHIAESPSSSEKGTVVTGAPPGLACRPPVVSPLSISSVSVSTTPRASSVLISSRFRQRSDAAARTPRTPADYGFGRRPPATATSRPPSPQRCPPTLGSKPAARQPATTQRRAAHSTSSPSTATSPNTPQPDPPSSRQTTDPRPSPPPPRPVLQAPPRLPEPIVEPIDDPHLRSCVEYYTYTDWAREQRAEPLCSATLRFLSLGPPSPPPDDLLDYIPSTRHPPLAEVLTLATEGQLHTTDDNTILLVHRAHTDSTRHTCDPPPTPALKGHRTFRAVCHPADRDIAASKKRR